jgi:hypothetical protein
MSTKTLSSGTTSVRRSGRPKGVPSRQSQRMLDAWDDMKQANSKLNNAALLNLVAETLFGFRLNATVKKREKERLKRTLQRYGRI